MSISLRFWRANEYLDQCVGAVERGHVLRWERGKALRERGRTSRAALVEQAPAIGGGGDEYLAGIGRMGRPLDQSGPFERRHKPGHRWWAHLLGGGERPE